MVHKLFHWKRLDQNSNLPFNTHKERVPFFFYFIFCPFFCVCLCLVFFFFSFLPPPPPPQKKIATFKTRSHTQNIQVKHQQRNTSLLLPKCTKGKGLTNTLPPPPSLPQINHSLLMACSILGSFEGGKEYGLCFQFLTPRECCIESCISFWLI